MKTQFKYFITIIALLCIASCAFAQNAADSLIPYKKYPQLPSFEIRMLDSSVFNTYNIPKGKPTVFLLFSPDCDHCAMLAKEIKKQPDTVFSGINFYMITPPVALQDIRNFVDTNGLKSKTNIHFGQDKVFFFGSFYRARTVPFLVMYDADQQLVKAHTQVKNLETLLSTIQLAR